MRRRHKNHLRYEARYGWNKPRLDEKFTQDLVAAGLPLLDSSLVGRRRSAPRPFNSKNESTDISGHSPVGCQGIEVKATQAQGYQKLTEKDLRGDCLIWLHFGDFYEQDEPRPIELLMLPQPAGLVSVGDIEVEEFRSLPGLRRFAFDLASWTAVEVTGLLVPSPTLWIPASAPAPGISTAPLIHAGLLPKR